MKLTPLISGTVALSLLACGSLADARELSRVLPTKSVAADVTLPSAQEPHQKRRSSVNRKKEPKLSNPIVVDVDADFESKEGGFKVRFPGVPQVVRANTDTKVGQQELTFYVLDVGSQSYMAAFVDFPIVFEDEELIRKGYDGGRNRVINHPNTTLVSERDVYLDGKLGREIIFDDAEGRTWMRFFIVKQRMFQMGFGLRTQEKKSASELREVEKTAFEFFDTFKITGEPTSSKPTTSPE